jgi:hypothetical protein
MGAAQKKTTKKGEDEYRSKWLMGVTAAWGSM